MGWMRAPIRLPADRMPSTMISREGFRSSNRFPAKKLDRKDAAYLTLPIVWLQRNCKALMQTSKVPNRVTLTTTTCPLCSSSPVSLLYPSSPGGSQPVLIPTDLVPYKETFSEHLRSMPATQGLSRYLWATCTHPSIHISSGYVSVYHKPKKQNLLSLHLSFTYYHLLQDNTTELC